MRELTRAAICAKAIRNDLKAAFPTIKFSVKSESYAGGNSVNVHYSDGPTDEQVDKVIKKYQYGNFDGMTDSYEYSNKQEGIPQVQYVFANRSISDKYYMNACHVVQKVYADLENAEPPKTVGDLETDLGEFGDYMSWRNVAYRILNQIDLTSAAGIKHIPNYCGIRFRGFEAVRE